MKNTLTLTTAAVLLGTAATAGGMAEPIMTMEPAMVMEESAGSSAGLIIPLILLALIAAAVSQSSPDAPIPTGTILGSAGDDMLDDTELDVDLGLF